MTSTESIPSLNAIMIINFQLSLVITDVWCGTLSETSDFFLQKCPSFCMLEFLLHRLTELIW